MTKFRIVVQEVTNKKYTHIGQITVETKDEKIILEKLGLVFKNRKI